MKRSSQTVCTLMLMMASVAPAGAGVILLECERLVDTGAGQLLPRQGILIENNLVLSVGDLAGIADTPEAARAESVFRLDTCLPGLMDMHVHLRHQNSADHYIKRFTRNEADSALYAAHYARITLDAGFTTVRDMGDGSYETVALRNAIDGGYAVGPRIFAAGKSVATTGGHADPTNGFRRSLMGDPGPAEGVVNGPVEAAEAVRYRYKLGTDAIKITATGGVLSLASSGLNPQFTQEELDALVTTATEYGLHVAAHAHGTEGMRRAVLAGVTSIEHGTFMDQEVMDLMIARGTFWVPTLLAGKFVGEKALEPGYFPDMVAAKAATIGPAVTDTFRRALAAGVTIAFGTDSGVSPHGDNAIEFELMVDAGMDPMAALQSATVTPARLLGRDNSLGRIAPGFFADIIAVTGNPLEDMGTLQSVDFVMKDGVVYKHVE